MKLPPRLTQDVVKALRERYIATEWATKEFPEQVARTVLDAVPSGWKKNYDGEWLHNFMAPMGKRERQRLGEWWDWEEKFPFHPQRQWRLRAKRAAEGYTEFHPSRILVHNRFVRVRMNKQQFFNEWFTMDLDIGKHIPKLRLHFGRLEISFSVISKKSWKNP